MNIKNPFLNTCIAKKDAFLIHFEILEIHFNKLTIRNSFSNIENVLSNIRIELPGMPSWTIIDIL